MNSGINFNIYFKTEGSETEQMFTFSTSPGSLNTGTGSLILQAAFNQDAIRYFINLQIEGQVYDSSEAGFKNINALWEWIQENWINLGSWYYLPTLNKIVLYVNATSGSLAITEINGIQVLIPHLDDGQFFIVQLDGIESPEELLYTIGDLINWVQTNWTNGTWLTDGEYLIYKPYDNENHSLDLIASSVGAFSSGFNSGFTI